MLHKGRLFLTIKTFPFPFFGKVKNPVREHGASSMEKAIYTWGLIAPKTT